MVRAPLLLLALGLRSAAADPAVDLAEPSVDVEAETIACHGPPDEREPSYDEACVEAERAHAVGDGLSLYLAAKRMRGLDPQRARSCTSRFDDALAGIDVRDRGDYRVGVTAMKAGDLPRARACFRLALARDPSHQVAARRLGEVEVALARAAAEAERPAPPPAE
jgi:hypothetical protein